MEEIRKLYDYKLNIPSNMLSKIGVKKSESLKIIEVENGILLQKVNLDEESKEINIEPKINLETKEIKEPTNEYHLKVVKRDLVSIPMSLFNKYNLSKKKYNIEWDKNEKHIAKIVLNEKGKYAFRSNNIWSVGVPFKGNKLYKVVEGVEILLRDNGKGIEIVFDISSTKEILDTYSEKAIEEVKEKDNLKAEDVINEMYKTNYGIYYATIHKRFIVTLPSELIKNYNILNRRYTVVDRILKYENESLILKFDDNGIYSFPKNSALNLKTLANPIQIHENQDIEILVNDKYFIINFNVNKNKEGNKDKTEEIPSLKEDEIKKIKEKEQSRNDKISSDLYRKEIEKHIKAGVQFKFLKENELPDEQYCCKCGIELTNRDLSMYNSHRICNKCKSIELKKLFTPIKELAKLRRKGKC